MLALFSLAEDSRFSFSLSLQNHHDLSFLFHPDHPVRQRGRGPVVVAALPHLFWVLSSKMRDLDPSLCLHAYLGQRTCLPVPALCSLGWRNNCLPRIPDESSDGQGTSSDDGDHGLHGLVGPLGLRVKTAGNRN